MSKTFRCKICEIPFISTRVLKEHLKEDHSGVDDMKKFKCVHCDIEFELERTSNYRRHLRNIHRVEVDNRASKLICAICHNFVQGFYTKHLLTEHGVEVKIVTTNFDCFKEFVAWKEEMERETCTQYIKKSKPRDSLEYYNHTYYCSRSGVYKEQNKGLTKFKRSGSRKINAACPASLKVKEFKDGKCQVSFFSTHVGHKIDLEHLFLTNTEREFLAQKIKQGIPLRDIIDEVKNSETGLYKSKRLQRLTIKDLWNVATSFGLEQTIKRQGGKVHIKKKTQTSTSCKRQKLMSNLPSPSRKNQKVEVNGTGKELYDSIIKLEHDNAYEQHFKVLDEEIVLDTIPCDINSDNIFQYIPKYEIVSENEKRIVSENDLVIEEESRHENSIQELISSRVEDKKQELKYKFNELIDGLTFPEINFLNEEYEKLKDILNHKY